MIEVKRLVINSAGNVRESRVTAFVDCTEEEANTVLAAHYSALAKVESLYYKLRGQSYIVKYLFVYKDLYSLDIAISNANTGISKNITEANRYIAYSNTAYKMSNSRRGIKDNSMIINKVELKDFIYDVECRVVDGKYVSLIESEE